MAEHPGSDALDEARAASRAGDYARALDRYAWFFDNCLAIDPSYYGVRLSYVLDEWAELGKKYPPATEALQAKQRDTVTALTQTTSVELLHDLVAISRYLEQPQIAVDAFKQLHERKPALAAKAIHFAWEVLFESGEYALCAAHIPNASDRYDELLYFLDQSTKTCRPEYGDDYLGWVRKSFERDVEMLTTILSRTGRKPDADDIETRMARDKAQRGLS